MTSISKATARLNAMTVDVEDFFQVSAFESHIDRSTWKTQTLRVEANVDRILALFDQYDVKATFYTLGWIAERVPGIARRIVEEGHELASHGWEHARVHTQKPEEFREDISRTKKVLEDLGGVQIKGYRAASYSINDANRWAWEVLADCGYQYSSSIVPIKHDLYGMPGAPRFAFEAVKGRLTEIPVTTISLAGRNINCGGGGWFRLFPYRFSRWALRHINNVEKASGMFYFHPWEIDPGQPRLSGLSAKTRFRHYHNLAKMQSRIERLLCDFHWDRMDSVFADVLGAEASTVNAVNGGAGA